MTGGELLALLFTDVPGDEEVVKAGAGRIMPDKWVPPIKDAIRNPADWLSRYLISIVRKPRYEMGDAGAYFAHASKGGTHVEAHVVIPDDADINDDQSRWNVWHEIGHACDFVSTRENLLIATPHGLYSTAHIQVLRKHQELIITWTPCRDREYKVSPPELWAEVVACAICDPWKMPEELLAAVRPDLVKLCLPVPEVAPLPPVKPTLSEVGQLPYTIATMLQQMGGLGLTGAFVCNGGSDLRHRHPDYGFDEETKGSGAKWNDTTLKYDVGIDFAVNGKRGEGWRMAVTYEPLDTYSVWLWQTKLGQALLDSAAYVYGDNLQRAVADMYDQAINKFNGGFIPMGDDR